MASPPDPILRAPSDFERQFPDGSALATECVLNFGLLSGGVHSALRRLLENHGVPSMAAFNVLAILDGASAPLGPSIIAERMVVTRATISGVLDSLERRRLIRRLPDRRDSRRRLVELTTEGSDVIKALLPVVHRWEASLLSCLTYDQQRELLRFLATLQGQLTRMEPDADLLVPNEL